MSAGAQMVGGKIDILIDINKRLLAVLGGDKKGDKPGGDKKGGSGPKINEDDAKKLTGLAGAVKDLVDAAAKADAIKPGGATKIVKFYETFSKGISNALKELDPKKAQEFGNMMEKLVGGAAGLVKAMALTAILSPLAILGAKAFGFIVKGLAATISKLPEMKAKILKGLETLFGMAKGIAIFMLVMVGISFLAIPVAIGTLVFILVITGLSLGLRLVEKIGGDGTGFNKGPVGSLLKMGKAIAIFMLVMVGIGMLAQQVAIGALVFITVILGLSIVLRLVSLIAGDGTGLIKGPLGGLIKMGRTIALFALTMVILSYVAVPFALGALVFILVVGALAITFRLVSLIAGDGSGFNKGPLGGLIKMSKAVFIFSLVFIVIGAFFLVPFAIGALAVILAIGALAFVIPLLGTVPARRGARNLLTLSYALGIFTASMLVWALFVAPKLTWEGIAMLAAVIGVMGLIGAILGEEESSKAVDKGAKSLMLLGAALAIFAAGLSIYTLLAAPTLTWEKLAILGAVIGVMALIGTLLGIPPIAGFAYAGAIVLIALGGAVALMSIGLAIFTASGFDAKDGDNLKHALHSIILGMFGYENMDDIGIGAIVWIPSLILFLLGTGVAFILVSAAITILAMGLAIFAASGFDEEDGDNLKHALHSIICGFLGYESLNDIGVGALAWVPSLTAFLLMTSYAFVIASIALLPLSIALKIFKMTGWTSADSMNLQFALISIAGAFAAVAEGDRWYRTMLGIYGMRDVGATLVSLAAGIQAMANMTFVEYEWDETTKRLEPKRKVKLTRDDVKVAADNAAYTISVLAEPLARFGDVMSRAKPAGDFFGIGPNSIEKGINSLGSLGRGLVSIAKGVQDWASMSYWEYDLVMNPETKMNELKPVKKRKITSTEIGEATGNISFVISSLAKPIAEWGKLMEGADEKSGAYAKLGFSKNSIEKGISSLSSLGKSLVSLATGVKDWASMSYWEFAVQMNPKTKMNELTPINKKHLGKPEIEAATGNIVTVLGAMAKPIAEWGKLMEGADEKSGAYAKLGFSKNSIEKGISSLSSLGKSLGRLAMGVKDWVTLSYWEYELVMNPKTKMNELKPTNKKQIGSAEITTATGNIATVLGAMAKPIADWGKLMEGADSDNVFAALGISKNSIEKGIASLSALGKGISSMASGVKAFASMQFVEWDVVMDPKTKMNKLVPGKVVKMDDALLKLATDNLAKVLGASARAIVIFDNELKVLGGADVVSKIMDNAMKLTTTFGTVYKSLKTLFGDGPKMAIVMNNYKSFFTRLFNVMSVPKLALFGIFNALMQRHIQQTIQLSNNYTKMTMTLSPVLIQKYDKFTQTTERLAKTVPTFERFVKAFGTMAKDMGIFATNFKVMGPDGIVAFKDWTDSMVSVSKIDISKSSGIIGFINDSVSAAFGGGANPANPKKGTDMSPADKKDAVNRQNDKGNKGGETEGGKPAAPDKIDMAAITSAITQALENLSVQRITVMGDIVQG